MCTSEAGVEGAAACDLGVDGGFPHVTYADAARDGAVVADVAVRQVVTTPSPGPSIAARRAERCIVAIGAVSDYDRSGGTAIGFAGPPRSPAVARRRARPRCTSRAPSPCRRRPCCPAHDAEILPVPGRPVRCPVPGPRRRRRHGGADVVVEPMFRDHDGLDVVCEGQCVLRVGGIGLDESSAAPEPVDVPFAFGPPGSVPGTFVSAGTPDPSVVGLAPEPVLEPATTLPGTTVPVPVPTTPTTPTATGG